MNAIKVIIYFSIFKYPVTKAEIFSFSSAKNITDIEKQLTDLTERKIVFKHGDYYSETDDASQVNRRLNGNTMAEAIMPKALQRARLIMSFPYIESVSISGALAKGYYDNDGDIDFFIITKPNRLWLARTLLVTYKKVFLLNSKKHFCVNYFISSDHFNIAEKNTFTATELLTLIPVFGKSTFTKFIASNDWAKAIYPNKIINTSLLTEAKAKPFWSKTIQFLFNSTLGEKLEDFLKKTTLKKWKSKFKHLNKNDFEIAMKSTNDVSKHHPRDFQSKVIDRLNEQYDAKNKTFDLNLTREHA
jgi:hypothetical protein